MSGPRARTGYLPRNPVITALWTAQGGLHRGYLMDVVTALFIGAHLVCSGRARTRAPAWATLNASGGPVVWGAILLGLGAALILAACVGTYAVLAVMLLLASFYGLLALWFFKSSLPVETGASFVGAWFAFRAMGMHLSRAWAYWRGGA